jgi:hypothetical protein
MARKSKRSRSTTTAARQAAGQPPVLEDLFRRSIARAREQTQARLAERSATAREVAEQFGLASGMSDVDATTPQARRAQDALRKLHDKHAKQKVSVANLRPGLGGVFPDATTVTVVPPFDYDILIQGALAGNAATLQGSSSKSTGKMDLSAVTSSDKGFGGGSVYTTVGVYFHPPGPGTLTLRAAPTYSFQWWTNSLRPTADVRSFGSVTLTVYGVDLAHQTIGETGTILATANSVLHLWDESQTGEIRLDFGFDLQTSGSVQLDVTRQLVYLLFVAADVHVHGVGWPGSLAGAKLAVGVPSLTYEFRAQQVLDPG